MTKNKRIEEWLKRVAVEISTLKSSSNADNSIKLEKIKDCYQILSVMIRVAEGKAYMVGITPPKGN